MNMFCKYFYSPFKISYNKIENPIKKKKTAFTI